MLHASHTRSLCSLPRCAAASARDVRAVAFLIAFGLVVFLFVCLLLCPPTPPLDAQNRSMTRWMDRMRASHGVCARRGVSAMGVRRHRDMVPEDQTAPHRGEAAPFITLHYMTLHYVKLQRRLTAAAATPQASARHGGMLACGGWNRVMSAGQVMTDTSPPRCRARSPAARAPPPPTPTRGRTTIDDGRRVTFRHVALHCCTTRASSAHHPAPRARPMTASEREEEARSV